MPFEGQPSLLFEPLTIRSVTTRNRIVVSPMCQYVSKDGGPTDWHLVHLGKFAIGGAGIVFGDETAVEPCGRKTYECAGIYDPRHVAQYRRITEFLRAHGAVPAIQLGHSGRKGSSHGAMHDWKPLTEADAAEGRAPWRPIAPSPLPATPHSPVPRQMTVADIKETIEAYRVATQRSVDAGFEVCEVHGAHGYLIHQFLSPVSNIRTDGYGGSLEGRMRFALEVAEAVRDVWPGEYPLFFRVSAVDGRGGQWSLDDTIALARALKERGVDVIDCSSGGIQGDGPMPPVPRVPGYHAGYARAVRAATGLPCMAAGMIAEPRHAEALLRDGSVDLIGMARHLMWQCDWPVHAAKELGVDGYLDLFPPAYAHRLEQLENHRRAYPPGCQVALPESPGRSLAYVWPAKVPQSG